MGARQDDDSAVSVVSVAAEIELVHASECEATSRQARMNGCQGHGVVKELHTFRLAASTTGSHSKFASRKTVTPEPDERPNEQQCDKNRTHGWPLQYEQAQRTR